MAAPETFLQPDPRTVTSWTLQSIQAAETAANEGQISQAALLCDQLFADSRIGGCFAQRTSLVRMVPAFEPGRGSHAKAAAEALEAGDYWAMTPAAELRKLQRWGLGLGFGYGQMRWVDEAGNAYLNEGRNAPRLHTWHPQHAEWDGRKRKWFAYVGDGTRREEISAENGWVIYTPFGADAPWKEGLWRSLKVWWTLKQLAAQDWARYSEKNGIGAFVAEAPEGTEDGTRKALARELRRLGREKGFALPVGWKLKMVEATAKTYETFVDQIKLANTEAAIAIVGQNLTSEVSGGSFAAANIHESVSSTIVGADGEALSDFEHGQIQRPYAAANWGDPDAAAWPVRDTAPPEDVAAKVESQQNTLALPALARDAGYEIKNFAELAERVGLELEELERVEPPKAPKEPPPGPDDTDPAAKGGGPVAALASGDRVRAESGFVSGQLYTDQVADDSRDEAGELLADDVTQLLGILDGAEDYESIRTKLLSHYEGMDSADLAELVQRSLVLTELAGRYAVEAELPKGARAQARAQGILELFSDAQSQAPQAVGAAGFPVPPPGSKAAAKLDELDREWREYCEESELRDAEECRANPEAAQAEERRIRNLAHGWADKRKRNARD